MVKMQHAAHCIQPLRESRLRPLCTRVAGVAHVLFGVITRAQMLQQATTTSNATHSRLSHGRNGFHAPAKYRFSWPANDAPTPGIVQEQFARHATPHCRQLRAAKSSQLHAGKLDAFALNRRATLVKGCISYIDTTHESFCVARTRVVLRS